MPEMMSHAARDKLSQLAVIYSDDDYMSIDDGLSKAAVSAWPPTAKYARQSTYAGVTTHTLFIATKVA